jgi:hypothetical protein
MARPAAASFARMVSNIANYPVGIETSFGAGSAHIGVWRPRENHWIISLLHVADDLASVDHSSMVAIVPGEYKEFEVVMGDGSMVLSDFRGIEAAVGFALDHVGSAAWLAGAQDEHDPLGI